jgi:hypothetical protein
VRYTSTGQVEQMRDSRNNVEQLGLDAPPEGGVFTVSVQGVNVPKGPQDYSLVITGDVEASDVCAQCVSYPPEIAACMVHNGEGRRLCNGRSEFGPCKAVRCDLGFLIAVDADTLDEQCVIGSVEVIMAIWLGTTMVVLIILCCWLRCTAPSGNTNGRRGGSSVGSKSSVVPMMAAPASAAHGGKDVKEVPLPAGPPSHPPKKVKAKVGSMHMVGHTN